MNIIENISGTGYWGSSSGEPYISSVTRNCIQLNLPVTITHH